MSLRAIAMLWGLAFLATLSSAGCGTDPADAPGKGGRGAQAGSANASAGAPDTAGASGGGKPGEGAAGEAAGGQELGGGDGAGGGSGVCGDGTKQSGEECDDANTTSGDGCSARCVEKCEVCERDTCPVEATLKVIAEGAYSGAYEMSGNAEAGPAINFPRKDLVRGLMECIYESNCLVVYPPAAGGAAANWEVSMRACACANAGEPTAFPTTCNDEATRMDGPCLDQMIEAAEVDTFLQMTAKLKTRTLPIGRAYELLKYCDAQVCAAECLAEETAELRSPSEP